MLLVLKELLITMISYLIILSIAAVGSAINCGVGVPVLTRIPNDQGTYAVDFQCLCPVDYYGIQCKNHRKIACYLSTKEFSPNVIDTTNFEAQKTFNVTFGAECYLEQSSGKFISFINYFFKKQTNEQNYKQELQSGIDGGEIIWANNSNLLTQNGIVKYQQGYDFTTDETGIKHLLKADEQKILYGNGPYKFEYKSQFLGFPLTNSSFKVSSNIYKILLNNRVLPKKDVQFINYENYTSILKDAYKKQEEAKSIYSNFSIQNFDYTKLNLDEISKQIDDLGKQVTQYSKVDAIPLIRATIKANLKEETQFGMLKAQFRIEQNYEETSVRHTSINSATVRIPIRVPGIGEATVYNSNFYKPPSRIVYLILVILAIGAIYVAYRIYLKRKISQRKKILLKVQSQYEENSMK